MHPAFTAKITGHLAGELLINNLALCYLERVQATGSSVLLLHDVSYCSGYREQAASASGISVPSVFDTF